MILDRRSPQALHDELEERSLDRRALRWRACLLCLPGLRECQPPGLDLGQDGLDEVRSHRIRLLARRKPPVVLVDGCPDRTAGGLPVEMVDAEVVAEEIG